MHACMLSCETGGATEREREIGGGRQGGREGREERLKDQKTVRVRVRARVCMCVCARAWAWMLNCLLSWLLSCACMPA